MINPASHNEGDPNRPIHLGKILARLPIGRGSDGCVFDSDRGLAFSSNGGDGTLTAAKEDAPGQFEFVATISTQQGARTMALNPKTHRIYLAVATYAPTADAKTQTKPDAASKRRRTRAQCCARIVRGLGRGGLIF